MRSIEAETLVKKMFEVWVSTEDDNNVEDHDCMGFGSECLVKVSEPNKNFLFKITFVEPDRNIIKIKITSGDYQFILDINEETYECLNYNLNDNLSMWNVDLKLIRETEWLRANLFLIDYDNDDVLYEAASNWLLFSIAERILNIVKMTQ